MEIWGTQNRKTILKKNEVRGLTRSYFKAYYELIRVLWYR